MSRWLGCFFGVWAVVLLTHAASGASPQSEEDLECGRKCLVIWLELNGISAERARVDALVPVGSNGSTMYDLQAASDALGFPSKVVDFGGGGIAALPLPSIVHVQLPDREFGGHFVVLINREGDNVFVIDPNIPKVLTSPIEDLSSVATGYALVSHDDLNSVFTLLNLFVATSVLVLVFLLVRVLWGSARNSRWVRVALPLCLLSVGCDGPEMEVVEYHKPLIQHDKTHLQLEKTQRGALSWDQNAKDFGFVGEREVMVEYLLDNRTSDPVEIFLGDVSCVCLSASLRKNEVLPGESVVLALSLSNGGLPGERRGSVAVGVKGSEESHFFSARAIFEGVSGHNVVYRVESGTLPRDELLVGRIVAGPSVKAEDVLLDNIEWSEGRIPDVAFSEFTVHEVHKNNVYSEFQYRVFVSPGTNIENGAYSFRMNLLISSKIRSFVGKLLVIAKAPAGEQK